jgi:NADH-quinone oxidoreductase E subunit
MADRNPHIVQPQSYSMSEEVASKSRKIIAKYPAGRQKSAVMPILDLVQRHNNNWLSVPAMQKVAEMLDMPYIKVYEVASFYTMYNLSPVGKYHLQVCRTTPCWIRGSDSLTNLCKTKLNVGKGETTSDGNFTLTEVECLGACVNAPVVQINDDFYEDLTSDMFSGILDALSEGKRPAHGTQIKRLNSAPIA